MLRRKGLFYRFIALTLAFAILGVAIFLPLLAGSQSGTNLVGIILLCVYAGIYVITMVVNEIYIHRFKKKEKKENADHS